MKKKFLNRKSVKGGYRKKKLSRRKKTQRNKTLKRKRMRGKLYGGPNKYVTLNDIQKRQIVEHLETSKRLAENFMRKVLVYLERKNDNNDNYIDFIYDESRRFFRTFVIRAEKFYKITQKELLNQVNYKIHTQFYKEMYSQYMNKEIRPLIENSDLYREYEYKTNVEDFENMFKPT